jgi:hypothetical protein
MKRYCMFALAFAILFSCTRQKVIDSGVSDPHFEGNMMEYLRSDSFNWALTVQLIEHAGLVELFEGNDPDYPRITFLGFTSQSVERFLYDSQFKDSSQGIFMSVQDVPVQLAREMVLKHVVAYAFTRDAVGLKDKEYQMGDPRQTGGSSFQAVSGNWIRAFRETSDWEGVPDAGPVYLRLYSIDRKRAIPVASPDIQPRNGVVHALNYSYEFPVI